MIYTVITVFAIIMMVFIIIRAWSRSDMSMPEALIFLVCLFVFASSIGGAAHEEIERSKTSTECECKCE